MFCGAGCVTVGFTDFVVPDFAAADPPIAVATTINPAKAIFLSIRAPCDFLVACFRATRRFLTSRPEQGEQLSIHGGKTCFQVLRLRVPGFPGIWDKT
jgi:hypothetical protein